MIRQGTRTAHFLLVLFSAFFSFHHVEAQASKAHVVTKPRDASIRTNDLHTYWIEFTDKGCTLAQFLQTEQADSLRATFAPEAIERRRLALHREEPLTFEDIPVAQQYLNVLAQDGHVPVTQSNWLNAITVVSTSQKIGDIASHPFIKCVRDLGLIVPPRTTARKWNGAQSLPQTVAGYDSVVYHYGPAATQLDRLHVTPLHQLGFDATDVRLGFFDTGFRWREHEALRTRKIISEYDYVFRDSVTENQDGDDPSQDGHGSATLGAATAYMPDSIIGPAYNATIMLAKTEDVRSETPKEEVNLANALEDMERKGLDVASISLGYFHFDSPYVSYTYKDLNGDSAVSTRAVTNAAKFGVLCCVAAGNTGESEEKHIMAPADAKPIITVGALELNDSIATFSSRGPTADGRIKPEIAAPGVDVRCTNNVGGYMTLTGTSLATPLVSGACALIKQIHPVAGAQQIRSAVIRTADHYFTPDTAYGYGRINAYAAALWIGDIITKGAAHPVAEGVDVCVGAASQYGIRKVTLLYQVFGANRTNGMEEMTLAADSNIYHLTVTMQPGDTLYYKVQMTNGSGANLLVPSGSFAEYDNPPASSVRSSSAPVLSKKLSIAPNPSRDRAIVTLREQTTGGMLHLYDALGKLVSMQQVRPHEGSVTLQVHDLPNGIYYLQFMPADASKEVLPSLNIRLIVAH